VIRLTRARSAVVVPAALASVALVAAGCGTGTTSVPTQASTPSASTNAAAAGSSGFPTDQDGPVLDAARTFTEKVTTYDHTKLGDQRDAVLPLTGEPLKGDLTKSLADGGDFANTVTANSRDAKGTVLDLGLVSREGDRAVVLLFVDQQVTSPAGETTQRLRERVTLSRAKSGAWLAVKIETL
jgi:hypothetical protein